MSIHILRIAERAGANGQGHPLYRHPDTGEAVTWYRLPAGTLTEHNGDCKGSDGKAWQLKLPGDHRWLIDQPIEGGGCWTRTGEAPALTITPSILIQATAGERVLRVLYHGKVTSGRLVSEPDSPL